MIILSPAKSYYSGEVKVLIVDILVEQQMVELSCKAAGNYRTILSTSLANAAGFQQVIWTDDATQTKRQR
jgi:branched-chain amino acid aminotransferase